MDDFNITNKEWNAAKNIFKSFIRQENIEFRVFNSKRCFADISGDNQKIVIRLSKLAKNDGTKMFALFHELGHYYLHGYRDFKNGLIDDYDIIDNLISRDEQEKEADFFAFICVRNLGLTITKDDVIINPLPNDTKRVFNFTERFFSDYSTISREF